MISGTNTILAFMTLASKVENSLPKVSYIKASEIWFLGCTIFLFAAMVEFAFVNTIYRRKYVHFRKFNIYKYYLFIRNELFKDKMHHICAEKTYR